MEKLCNYVNGKYIEPLSDQYIDNFEPATGKVYSLIPNSNEADGTRYEDYGAIAIDSN
jgi:aminomuconate-semialdehyde/2-hydroxymuconate-6-semialdehyde dehydrogenase